MLFRFEPETPRQSKACSAPEKPAGRNVKDVEHQHSTPTELPGTKPAMELSGIEPESYLEVLTYEAHERARGYLSGFFQIICDPGSSS